MPYTTHHHAELGVLFARITLNPTPEMVRGFRNEVESLLASHPETNQLLDLRGVRFTPDLKELRSLVAYDPFPAHALRAVLVPDALHYGVTRMYGSMVFEKGGHVVPFYELEAACEWLGIAVDVAEAGLASGDP